MKKNKKTPEIILKKLTDSIKKIKWVAIISVEGFPISSILKKGQNESNLAVMSATMLYIAKNASQQCDIGNFEHIIMQGFKNNLIVYTAGENAILAVITPKNVNIGIIDLNCQRTCKMIAEII